MNIQGWKSNLENFGALFSFPPNANNATAYIKGTNGNSQAYAGMCVSKDIEKFVSDLLLSVAQQLEGLKEPYTKGVGRIDENYRQDVNRGIDLAINQLKEAAKK